MEKKKKITLGLLNADELAPEVEKQFGNYSDMFQNLLGHTLFTYNTYQVTQEIYPPHINDCDAYLITGSKSSAYDNTPWIIKLKKFIKLLHKNNKKLIGICFGHQIIAEALGGKVNKSQKGWGTGLMQSEMMAHPPWMQEKIKSYSLLVSHQDQVDSLPKNASCIASSSFCKNSSFHIGDSILCFQGHPEFTKEYLQQLLIKRREIIGQGNYKKALVSLEHKADNSMLASWITNFIQG